MIQKAEVFEDDHLPNLIVGRNNQMNEVADALSPIEADRRADNCFLFGPSGSGKTTVARATVRELRNEVLDIPYGYVNCWKDHTRKMVLDRAIKEVAGAAVPRNTSTRDLIDKLDEEIDSPSVLILDEVDQLQDKKVLYDLYMISGLSWICIANREVDLFASLDNRIRSRISVGNSVHFRKYDIDTITEIVGRRARSGLTPGAVYDETLERIAELSDGDARTAITALYVAARKGVKEGLASIPTRLVEESVHDAKEEVRQKQYSKMNSHQCIIYDVVCEFGPINQGSMYEKYEKRSESALTVRTLRDNYLPKLEHYNMIEVERTGGETIYRIAS